MGIIKEAAKDAFKNSFGTIHFSSKIVKNGLARLAYVSAWMLTFAAVMMIYDGVMIPLKSFGIGAKEI